MKTLPDFKTKKELFKFLIKNKDTLIAQKTAVTKFEDCCIPYSNTFWDRTTKQIIKASEPFDQNVTELKAACVINTTNFFDSHSDVHLPGLWDKSIQENKMIMHLQEHIMKFASIVSDGSDLEARVKEYTWKDLGFDLPGSTQALVFDSIIKRSRNPFMFDQYRKGYVKNHSVGMRYVAGKLILCINDEEAGAEFEAWQKYIPEVANRETAENNGFMWIVNEAKVIEGSAVPLGSNIATPTFSIEENKLQPGQTTEVNDKDQDQPGQTTEEGQQPGQTTAKSFNNLLFLT